ncbi:MAG: efflux RND transporter periplasmic adaptor subunit [Actinobacteria bacterium]|nr:efflux RND transporter periplasmic adaptor subunit [Actinomycetota bacterium]
MKRVVVVGALLGAATAGEVVWILRGTGSQVAGPVTITARRGDLVVSVGGLGRIVQRNESAISAPTTPAAGSSATPAGTTSGPGSVSSDTVFPDVSGRVARVFVTVGERIRSAQVLLTLDDGGLAAMAVAQAESDLATARLELAQKRVSDPGRGAPPTARELAAAEAAIRLARQRLTVAGGNPSPVDVAAAQVELTRTRADLESLRRSPGPAAFAAAQAAADAAAQKLREVQAVSTSVDTATAQSELKKAQADLAALQRPATAPSASALAAARAAVQAAQLKVDALGPQPSPADQAAAQLELARAQAELDALQQAPPPPTPQSVAAAQAAVDAATRRVAQLASPSPTAVTTAQAEFAKAQADLETLRKPPSQAAITAANAAVQLARRRLSELLSPGAATRNVARLDLAKAIADRDVLRGRGAPAGARDIGIAELKVSAMAARLSLAVRQMDRLTVRSTQSGTVTAVLGAPGSPVDSTTPVARVTDLGRLSVRANLSEFDAARVRRGMSVAISVDALGGRRLRGRVAFEALVGEDNGGVVTFPVRISIDRAGAGVKPGMNASVRIIVARRRRAVVLPLDAIRDVAGGEGTVGIVDGAGRRSDRTVRIGLSNNKDAEIIAGLRPGERVTAAPGG